MLDAPVSFVTLVGLDEQVLPGAWRQDDPDNDARGMPLRESFCQFSVATHEPLVINDARRDPLVQHMVPAQNQDVGAYAGYPLQTNSGHVLGSLCVIDRQPRQWTEEQLALLRDLAAMVLLEIEHRLAARTIEDIRGLTGQLFTRLDGMADAVRGLADLTEQHDDLRLHRYAAMALSRVDQVKDLTVRLQREATDWVGTAGKPTSVDLREVVDRAVRSTRLATGSNALDVELGSVSLLVRCDPVELERSITHTLIAALHHASAGSQLRVLVEPEGGSGGKRARHEAAQLMVSGRSSRVPAAELARIVARLRAGVCEGAPEQSEPAAIRMVAGKTVASTGSVTASSSAEGLTLVARWALDRAEHPAVSDVPSPRGAIGAGTG